MGDWIDVRERLPEKGQVCLMIVQYRVNITRREVILGIFDNRHEGNARFCSFIPARWSNKGDFELATKSDVRYWMPVDLGDLPGWKQSDFVAEQIAEEEREIAKRRAYVERLRKQTENDDE